MLLYQSIWWQRCLQIGTQVKVMPSGEEGTIKTIVLNKKGLSLARAGDSADITLSGFDTGVLISGLPHNHSLTHYIRILSSSMYCSKMICEDTRMEILLMRSVADWQARLLSSVSESESTSLYYSHGLQQRTIAYNRTLILRRRFGMALSTLLTILRPTNLCHCLDTASDVQLQVLLYAIQSSQCQWSPSSMPE